MKSFVDIFTCLVDKTSGLVDKIDTFVDISNLAGKVSNSVNKIAAFMIGDNIVHSYKKQRKGFSPFRCYTLLH